jgi:hypothetical protein
MEVATNSSGFQIKPDLENILHASTVKELIQKVKFSQKVPKTQQ